MECEKTSERSKIRTIMYVKDTLSYRRHLDLEKAESHIILLSFTKKGFGLASIYRTYKLTHKSTYEDALEEQISVLESFMKEQESVIIAGDINFDYNRRTDPSYHLRRLYDKWLSLEEVSQLVQLVDFKTWSRTCQGQLKQSTLDHVLTNNHSLIESVEEGSAATSDHVPVIITLTVCKEKGQPAIIWARDWKNYSPEILEERLSAVDWNITCTGVQDYNDELEQKIMTVLEKIIPFGWRNLSKKKVQDSWTMRELKRKKKTY